MLALGHMFTRILSQSNFSVYKINSLKNINTLNYIKDNIDNIDVARKREFYIYLREFCYLTFHRLKYF